MLVSAREKQSAGLHPVSRKINVHSRSLVNALEQAKTTTKTGGGNWKGTVTQAI